MSYISFEDVCKDYPAGNTVVHASDHVNFQIEKGEFCVVLGPSGAGKTTVLNLLGGMDKATSGRIIVGDKEITGLRSPRRGFRLSVLQPDAEPDGAGERRIGAAGLRTRA